MLIYWTRKIIRSLTPILKYKTSLLKSLVNACTWSINLSNSSLSFITSMTATASEVHNSRAQMINVPLFGFLTVAQHQRSSEPACTCVMRQRGREGNGLSLWIFSIMKLCFPYSPEWDWPEFVQAALSCWRFWV